MSQVKDARINEILEKCSGGPHNPHYAGFFYAFNHQLYFEAHEVLEALWLKRKGEENWAFYKGLIQLAGAFVHMQKQRLGPAASLLRLARANFVPYGDFYESFPIKATTDRIHRWLQKLESSNYTANPLLEEGPPQLTLVESR